MDKVQESLSELFDSGYRLGESYGYKRALKEAIANLHVLLNKYQEEEEK